MQNRTATIIVLSLSLAACGDAPDLDTVALEDDTTEGDSTDGELPELPESDLPSGESVWIVVDSHAAFVGQLATPSPEEILDHTDVFSPGSPEVLHLTADDGYGFVFNQFGAGYVKIAHDEIMFSEDGCKGTPSDWMVTRKDGVPMAEADCNDATINAKLASLMLHYSEEAVANAWLDLNWPGAKGLLVNRDGGDRWYRLPLDQAWPSFENVASQRLLDGTCVDTAIEFGACVVTFEETDWRPDGPGAKWSGPYRLVQAL